MAVQGFGATACRLRKNELPPSLKASEESSAGGAIFSISYQTQNHP